MQWVFPIIFSELLLCYIHLVRMYVSYLPVDRHQYSSPSFLLLVKLILVFLFFLCPLRF